MIALAADAQFAPGSVIACYFGWLHELIAQMIAWTESQGLDPAAARLLVAQMTRAAATIIRERTDASPAQLCLGACHATLLHPLRHRGPPPRARAFEAWPDAASRLAERFKGEALGIIHQALVRGPCPLPTAYFLLPLH